MAVRKPPIKGRHCQAAGREQGQDLGEEAFGQAGRVKITFVYFDAGGGHRSAMNALRAVIRDQQRPWEVTCLNLQEELDAIDFAKKLTGHRVQDVYNLLLKKGWTLGTRQLLPDICAPGQK